jgi:hypothetical protein
LGGTLSVYGSHPYHHPAGIAGIDVFDDTRIDAFLYKKIQFAKITTFFNRCLSDLAVIPYLQHSKIHEESVLSGGCE